MFVTKKHLPRRTFLRGMGVSLALPLLDSMIPARTLLAQTAARPVTRLGFVYFPHGAVMNSWTPATEGAGFEFSPILKPLEPFRNQLNVVTGLAHAAADSTAVHSLSPTTWLSGIRPKRTQGVDAYAGVTADQIAARAIGQGTMLPSLELASEDPSPQLGGNPGRKVLPSQRPYGNDCVTVRSASHGSGDANKRASETSTVSETRDLPLQERQNLGICPHPSTVRSGVGGGVEKASGGSPDGQTVETEEEN